RWHDAGGFQASRAQSHYALANISNSERGDRAIVRGAQTYPGDRAARCRFVRHTVMAGGFVNALNFINPAEVFIEIGQTSLKVLDGETGIELPLERAENGRLTEACREKLCAGLGDFLKARGWRPRPRAYCAIGARGVSLRRLTLPAASKEELQRLLPLQIESEFPLPPDQLAWGYSPIEVGRATLCAPGFAQPRDGAHG